MCCWLGHYSCIHAEQAWLTQAPPLHQLPACLPAARPSVASSQQELARLAAAPGPTPEALSEMLQKHKEKQQRMRDAAAARSPERSPQPNASSQGAPLALLLKAHKNLWLHCAVFNSISSDSQPYSTVCPRLLLLSAVTGRLSLQAGAVLALPACCLRCAVLWAACVRASHRRLCNSGHTGSGAELVGSSRFLIPSCSAH